MGYLGRLYGLKEGRVMGFPQLRLVRSVAFGLRLRAARESLDGKMEIYGEMGVQEPRVEDCLVIAEVPQDK